MRLSIALAGVASMAGTAAAFQSGDLLASTFAKGGHFRAFTFDGVASSAEALYHGEFRGVDRGTSDLKLDAVVHSNEKAADGAVMSWSLIDDQLSFARTSGNTVLNSGCMELHDAVHALPPYRLLARALDRSFPVAPEQVQAGPSLEVSDLCDPSMVQFFGKCCFVCVCVCWVVKKLRHFYFFFW
jgi:hypothetical protein